MRRLATAALLAAPLLLGAGGTAAANDGPCTFGLGCGGNCLRLFPFIHQHGPLFNYGPYYGYPPFEPYGNWNSYLQYTGPVPAPGHFSGPGAGAYGWIHGGQLLNHGGGLLHHGGGGIFHKHSSGCGACEAAASGYLNSGNALDRYTGFGTPAASAAYYTNSPAVITVGFPGR